MAKMNPLKVPHAKKPARNQALLNRHVLAIDKDGLMLDLKGESKVPIDLIGHSMGTIVANQILEYAPEVHFERIVYLAAACTVRDMNQWVISYMAHRERQDAIRVPHFYNLTLHPVAE